ncbi:MAG: hypothetical protein WC539_00050 [Nitrospirota bacterium]
MIGKGKRNFFDNKTIALHAQDIKEISDTIFTRVENKFNALGEREQSIDRKIDQLEQLIRKAVQATARESDERKQKALALEKAEAYLDAQEASLKDMFRALEERAAHHAQEWERRKTELAKLETSLNNKIAYLERLMKKTEVTETQATGVSRQHEIVSLSRRGLNSGEIANTLAIPVGEVELILGFHLQPA